MLFPLVSVHADANAANCADGGFGATDCVKNIAVPGADKASETGSELINVIKTFVNWVLGLLGLVALGLCLWAGFQMTTAANDTKKFDEGKTILKNAAIGLAIIALSWLIVSLVFWVLNNVTTKTIGA